MDRHPFEELPKWFGATCDYLPEVTNLFRRLDEAMTALNIKQHYATPWASDERSMESIARAIALQNVEFVSAPICKLLDGHKAMNLRWALNDARKTDDPILHELFDAVNTAVQRQFGRIEIVENGKGKLIFQERAPRTDLR